MKGKFIYHNSNSPDITRPNLKNMLSESEGLSNFTFDYKVHRNGTFNETLVEIQNYFINYTSEHHGPSLLLSQTPLSSNILRIYLSSLIDYPIINLVYLNNDISDNSSGSWKYNFTKIALFRLSKLLDLWSEKLEYLKDKRIG